MLELGLLLIAFLLILACGVFVAAEFSLLAVQRSSVENKVKRGDVRAKGVLQALTTLSTQLSSAQVGITLTNLLIGYLAEPAIARLVAPVLAALHVSEHFVTSISLVLGLLLATALTMIFGELVPKNLAIAKPYRVAAAVQLPLLMFTQFMRWPIRMLNASANGILRLFGIEPTEELASARSADELLSLVRRSAERGALPQESAVMLERSLNFGELRALDAITPRLRVKALAADSSVEDVLELAKSSGFSRFPVYGDNLDDIRGIVHVKYAFAVSKRQRGSTNVKEIMTKPLFVPSSISLEALLDDLRLDGMQMAVAVDEFGAIDGIVTVEDLLEELVGDVKDEHDTSGAKARALKNGNWNISGLLRPDELAELTGVYLPEHDDVETIAGLVAHHLERIPKVGDTATLSGVDRAGNAMVIRLKVRKMDGQRIDRLVLDSEVKV